MAAFRKMVNALRPNKTHDKILAPTCSGHTRPSTYSFRNNLDVSHRTSVMSTISDVTHPVNYANELSNWRQMNAANTGMSAANGAMMPGGFYGQFGYADPYMGTIPFQNSNYGYPLIPDNHPLLPTDNAMFSDNRLMGAENYLAHMTQLAPLSESRSQFPNMHADTYRSSMIAIPLDKLKRMRAAKDLYNLLSYLDKDDSFFKKTNKSNGMKSKANNKSPF